MNRTKLRAARTAGGESARAWLGAIALLLAIGLQPGSAAGDGLIPLPTQPAGVAWPTEEWPRGELPAGVRRVVFDASARGLFAAVGRGGLPDTRALLIVHRGRIVYERYAKGFGPTSRFQSWSMAKSVTQSLVGVLVRQGKLDLAAPAPVPEWRAPGDPRAPITLDDMLHMTTGLANDDGFAEGGAAFVGAAIFGKGARSPAAYSLAVDVVHPSGTHWAYSTGGSMIVAAVAGNAIGANERERLNFMRRELFTPLGMTSAVPEFDTTGQFMGGGFFYASAEDWARFGYLYLRDGVWDGRRILPEGWVDYSRTPAPVANNGVHGAHFWTNAEPAEDQWKMYPGAPTSVFAAEGNGFQVVAMAPSRDLVIVRLGELLASGFDEQRARIGRLIASFPPLPGDR